MSSDTVLNEIPFREIALTKNIVKQSDYEIIKNSSLEEYDESKYTYNLVDNTGMFIPHKYFNNENISYIGITNVEQLELPLNKLYSPTPIKKKRNEYLYMQQEMAKQRDDLNRKRAANANTSYPYKPTKLVTDAELKLYNFMRDNLPHNDKIAILAKIRVGDLVRWDKEVNNNIEKLYKITSRHVDFVVCRLDNLKVLCVVELHDFYHSKEDVSEADRDKYWIFNEVGLPFVTIKTPIANISKNDLKDIENTIYSEFAPCCPSCGSKMILQSSFKQSNYGHRFYSCLNKIEVCGMTIDIDPKGDTY